METFAIMRIVTIAALMIGSAWLIQRYRAIGAVLSILAGPAVLIIVYSNWPAPPVPYDWDEDRQNMPFIGPILMLIWCLPAWGVTELWRWLRRRRNPVHEHA